MVKAPGYWEDSRAVGVGVRAGGWNNENLKVNTGRSDVKVLEIKECSARLLLFPRSPKRLLSCFSYLRTVT